MVQSDPLASPMWEYLRPQLLGDEPVRFDAGVKVLMPGIAENQRVYPVTVDARGIAGVDRIRIFSDLSPAQLALTYDISGGHAFVGTRIKLDQRTPVRGAAHVKGEGWVVGGAWIDAAGGGCSAPPVSRVAGNWAQTIGQVRGEAWRQPGGIRLRLAYKHPMDTGFVDNIAAFYIETVTVKTPDGRVLARLDTLQSVSEDPAFTLLLRADPGVTDLVAEARDTGGSVYAARITVRA